MSLYTTTLYDVMKDKGDYYKSPRDIITLIKDTRGKIFDFDYQTPNSINKEVFKEWFETSLLSKYAMWEIGFDTYEQFHLQLFSKCQIVMPKYIALLDKYFALNNTSQDDMYNIKKGTVKDDVTGTKSTKSDNKTISSTLPANMINANSIGEVQYADSGNKNESLNNQTYNDNDLTTYDLKMGNYISNITDFLKSMNDETKNIFDDLFNEFSILFIGLL